MLGKYYKWREIRDRKQRAVFFLQLAEALLSRSFDSADGSDAELMLGEAGSRYLERAMNEAAVLNALQAD